MSTRAEYRPEVKTRLRPRTHDAMHKFKRLHGIESDSAALSRIADLFLLGAIGNLPEDLLGVSADAAQSGTAVRA
ncbi:hypothetical protein [Burkholderia stagnalis]|uniref:hypothetical protein n=1 Tax=Burkholderia stagnalis TaxID=1503054 RepID=UPI00325AFF73